MNEIEKKQFEEDMVKCLCGNLLTGWDSFCNQCGREKITLTISQKDEIREWIQDYNNFGNIKKALESRAYKIMKELIKK